MNLLKNFHLAVIEYLYHGRRAVSPQTFTTRHSNRKVSIVMASSTTVTQCAPKNTKFVKITQITAILPSRSLKVTDFGTNRNIIYDFLSRRYLCKYYTLSLEFINLLGIYTVGLARSLCRRLLLDLVIVNCL